MPLILNGTTGISGIDGSAGTPSYQGTDSDTGLWYPAANTVALSTGGSERLRIDSSGNVGIGNTPSGNSAIGYRSLELGTTAGTGITAGNGDFYVPVNAYVAGGAWKYATTLTASLLNINTTTLTWSNAVSGTAGNNISFSERMRIDSSGNVGIGLTDPANWGKLVVAGLGTTTPTNFENLRASSIVIYDTNGATAGSTSGFFVARGSSGGVSYGLAGGYGVMRNSAVDWGTNLTFYTHPADTADIKQLVERMRIDSSGNVGIGTSSPSSRLSVTGTANIATFDGGTNTSITLTGSGRSDIFLIDSGAATDQKRLTIRGDGGNFVFGVENDAVTTFTERMRITSDGYVGIGTTTPASYGALAVRKGVNGTWIGVSGECSFQTSDAVNSSLYVVHSSANSGTTFIGTDAAGRLQMFCSSSASGGVYLANGGTSWTSASDERVKENLAPIQNGLEKVTSLRAVTGNFINDENKKSRAFLIAQDVQKVFPQAVDSSNPDELGLAYTDVIPLLVAAMKEQQAMIEELKQEVALLKSK